MLFERKLNDRQSLMYDATLNVFTGEVEGSYWVRCKDKAGKVIRNVYREFCPKNTPQEAFLNQEFQKLAPVPMRLALHVKACRFFKTV